MRKYDGSQWYAQYVGDTSHVYKHFFFLYIKNKKNIKKDKE